MSAFPDTVTVVVQVDEPAGTTIVSPELAELIAVCTAACDTPEAVMVAAWAEEVNAKDRSAIERRARAAEDNAEFWFIEKEDGDNCIANTGTRLSAVDKLTDRSRVLLIESLKFCMWFPLIKKSSEMLQNMLGEHVI